MEFDLSSLTNVIDAIIKVELVFDCGNASIAGDHAIKLSILNTPGYTPGLSNNPQTAYSDLNGAYNTDLGNITLKPNTVDIKQSLQQKYITTYYSPNPNPGYLRLSLVHSDESNNGIIISNAKLVVTHYTIPSTPTNLKANAISPASAVITWDASSGPATLYTVYYRVSGSSSAYTKVTSPVTNKALTGLSSNTTYECYVTAENPAGVSGNSAILTFTTLVIPPSISGASTVCSTSETYTLNNNYLGNWSVSGNLQFDTNSTTNVNSVTVKPKAYDGTSGTLTAVVNGTTVTKTVTACSLYLAGPDDCCDEYYSVGGSSILPYSTHNCSVSSGFQITMGGNTDVYRVKALSSSNGDGTLTFHVNSVPITKTIYQCPAISGPVKWCGEAKYNLAISGTASSWDVQPSNYFSIKQSSSTWVVIEQAYGNLLGMTGVVIGIVNGIGYIRNFTITNNRGGDSIAYNSYFTIYPNPTDRLLYIDIDADAAQTMLPSPINSKISLTFDVRLYDGMGNLLRQKKTKGGIVEFDVSNFRNGIYFIHVYNSVNSMPEIRQVMVEH